MAGKSVSHSESWWATEAPPHVLRCNSSYKSTGEQCRRVAVDGSIVCDQHGGAAGQVRRRAAERIAFTADDAARNLVDWMNDPAVDMRERVKITQDLLDRAGLAAAQVHKIMPITEDPIEALFAKLLDDPNALEPAGLRDAPPVTEAVLGDTYEDLIGTLPEQDETAPRAAERPRPDPSLTQANEKPAEPRSPLKPPKHIREGLERMGQL
jgi:hypothetical protein